MARLRGNRWQADAIVDGKRKRQSFTTEAEAYAWENAHTPEAPKANAKAVTLSSLSQTLETDLWGTGDNAMTARRHVDEAVEILGDVAVPDFKQFHITKLTAAYLRKGNSAGTLNRKYSTLSTLMRRAVLDEIAEKMPVFSRRKEPEGRVRFLTREEETTLFGTMGKMDPRHIDLAVFLVDTGARFSEALDLRWTRIDMVEKKLTFTGTKTDLTRSIPMTGRVFAMLTAHRGLASPFADVKPHMWRASWRKARKDAELNEDPNVVPHILRHTCASRLVQAGHSLFHVGKWLGHKSPTMTNRYAHLAPNTLDKLAESLDAMV